MFQFQSISTLTFVFEVIATEITQEHHSEYLQNSSLKAIILNTGSCQNHQQFTKKTLSVLQQMHKSK